VAGVARGARETRSLISISQPGDRWEREADQMAARVMRMPEPTGTSRLDAESSALPPSTAASGSPLPEPVRAFFEPRFGHDFSAVRIHTGEAAAEMNAALGARAFTFNNHISIPAREAAAPASLLAHELAHVVQAHDGAPAMIRRKTEDWNYTRADFSALKKSKGDLKISADSNWVPAKVKENILSTLRFALDAARSPTVTDGINLSDFYHGHLVVPNKGKSNDVSIDADEARHKFGRELTKVKEDTLGGEFEDVKSKNYDAYAKALKTTYPAMAKSMDEIVKTAGGGVMYHTYEISAPADLPAKSGSLSPSDPRRNIFTPFATNTPDNYHLKKGMTDFTDEFVNFMEFTFLVDKNGDAHVRPGGRDPLSTVIGKPVPQ
jgi:Domain of unknown function (DUF4157)